MSECTLDYPTYMFQCTFHNSDPLKMFGLVCGYVGGGGGGGGV